ncbi:hypothetical protein GUJ93_ZPchr0003g17287 [Zizania palustris]|uniref:Uncharacterized protein n=1 Tax=Zizania palustris TaxID=103762 RepID=A0A8J5VEQ7_ZIZPA|nr:hypothetical protein GUJ93_ZPchr0003g17287 [Zizania palustris]
MQWQLGEGRHIRPGYPLRIIHFPSIILHLHIIRSRSIGFIQIRCNKDLLIYPILNPLWLPRKNLTVERVWVATFWGKIIFIRRENIRKIMIKNINRKGPRPASTIHRVAHFHRDATWNIQGIIKQNLKKHPGKTRIL